MPQYVNNYKWASHKGCDEFDFADEEAQAAAAGWAQPAELLKEAPGKRSRGDDGGNFSKLAKVVRKPTAAEMPPNDHVNQPVVVSPFVAAKFASTNPFAALESGDEAPSLAEREATAAQAKAEAEVARKADLAAAKLAAKEAAAAKRAEKAAAVKAAAVEKAASAAIKVKAAVKEVKVGLTPVARRTRKAATNIGESVTAAFSAIAKSPMMLKTKSMFAKSTKAPLQPSSPIAANAAPVARRSSRLR